jgi:N-acetyl-gamma-glutamyl-phosphate reductase
MGLTAGIAGGSGYAGGELLRYLLGHPHVEIGPICAATHAGHPVVSAHSSLLPLGQRTFDPTDPELLAGCDIVFTALPHGQSAALIAELPASCRVVDLGADFRLADPAAWDRYYTGSHAGSWTYGLPELTGAREQIVASSRVASPGCYPTAAVLGLAPLMAAGLIEPADVVIVAASGTTGAGRSTTDSLSASAVMGSVAAYKAGGTHQHTPEMEQALTHAAGHPVTVSFTPLLAPMPRGILATCTARLVAGVSSTQIHEAFRIAYDDEAFVHVLPDEVWPTTKATTGTNHCLVQGVADEHSGRAVVAVALDNLGKGAAGQAVQNANLILGLAENAGLGPAGVAP